MEQTPEPRDRRPDALGDLRVLSDELICAILDHLSSSDLVRLSCVSSVFYIFCNEEPLWMNLCLRDGGPLEYENSWKRTALYRQNLLTRDGECRSHSLQFDGFSSLYLYRRWYRCFTTLDNFSFDSEDLERRKNHTLDELNYTFDEKKPILFTEVANNWPARYKWTVDQLLSNYGDVAFRLSQRSPKKISMKLKEYVSYMRFQRDEDPLYIFDDKFGEAAPALLQDYCAPYMFQEDFLDVLDFDQKPPFRWLIIGPERSGASWHVDPGLTSAWNTLFCGRKRWALYPPGRVPAGVTVHVNEDDGDVNIESPSSLQWWLDVYPLLTDQDKPLECTQLPGETIFVPSGWWHCVLNLDTTIAITQNFVNTSNFEFVCLDMSPGHVHKGVCRAGLLAVQNCFNGNPKGNEKIEMNLLNSSRILPREKRHKAMESLTDHNYHHSNWNSVASDSYNDCNPIFSYDIDFLSMFLNKEIDHYNTNWSPSNIVGERDMRAWLHRLWVLKPEIRNLIWKGSCLALNVEKWLACLMDICTHYNLTLPIDEEKFPVGTGSNPVFLVSDNVIKIFVEGGLLSSLHGLGTELEFYSLLAKTKSPLINHVPDIIASGFVVFDGSGYITYPWDGRGVPDVISNSNVSGEITKNEFPYGVWSKKKFELENLGVNSCLRIWPFIVSRRCDGDIFANLRDLLSQSETFHLASFLGEQLRHLHLLPLPNLETSVKETTLMEVKCYGFDNSRECELVMEPFERRKFNILNQLAQWGNPIPESLIEKVEKYLPNDLSTFLDIRKVADGTSKYITSPTWIHSDIMDDNIYLKQCYITDCFNEPSSHTSLIVNKHSCNGDANSKRWCPSHLLDFSDLSIGDPLYDLIPIYLDVFRGEKSLLNRFLEYYNLPLITIMHNNDGISSKLAENSNCKRLSYRAMCFCILNEENVLGAIFSLWRELRNAKSWEEVEDVVWGELNNYQYFNP